MSTTTLNTASVNSVQVIPTVVCSTAVPVPPIVSVPTKVVAKVPKHPINASVSQSMDMTHYLSKSTVTTVSTELPSKAKKSKSMALQADGRPLESSKTQVLQTSTTKYSSNKRKRSSLALPSLMLRLAQSRSQLNLLCLTSHQVVCLTLSPNLLSQMG